MKLIVDYNLLSTWKIDFACLGRIQELLLLLASIACFMCNTFKVELQDL
jgi:hypothetical protein